jgi:thiol peroxidase
METRRFNDEASKLGEDVVVVTISMDLPFAQKRWCGAAGVEHVQTFSDHREASFGQAYGVLIKELRLLARAVFVIDQQGTVRYRELVKEVADEPDYEAVLAAVRELPLSPQSSYIIHRSKLRMNPFSSYADRLYKVGVSLYLSGSR